MTNTLKKLLLLFLIILFTKFIIAQTTAIPDINFEIQLISKGYDHFPLNGSIPTANIIYFPML